MPSWFLRNVIRDLLCRGFTQNQITTFAYRFFATQRLLMQLKAGTLNSIEWNLKRCTELPSRTWSPEQQRALDVIAGALNVCDANDRGGRFFVMEGTPGSGKTEVLVHAATRAAMDGADVLICCPCCQLITIYKERLPPSAKIVVSSIHSAWRIREAQQGYDPPLAQL